MNTKIIYNLFKDITGEINTDKGTTYSFYFIEPFDNNDRGDISEYPKIILKKPISATSKEYTSNYSIVLEIVDHFVSDKDNILEYIEDEVDTIENTENILRDIINKLQSRSISVDEVTTLSIHEDYIDNVSGTEASFNISINNKLCYD
jgi:hypothetical protein